MRKLFIFFVLVFVFGCGSRNENFSNQVFVEAEGDEELVFDVELARSQGEIKAGLMFRKSLPENKGMFFIYDSEQILNFWMKNTFVPLDMIFIDENFRIVRIERNASPCIREGEVCPIYSSKLPAKYVLEIPAGISSVKGIFEGAKVEVNFKI